MHKWVAAGYAGSCSLVAFALLLMLAASARAQSPTNADALLAIDQQRASVVGRIVDVWGPMLAKSNDYVSVDDLRTRLMSLRADALLAASLAGTEVGLREVTGLVPVASKTSAAQTKALGDTSIDVVYTPVTPCRLVETRGTFAAVYQGNGTPAHTADPFAANQIRTYAIQGGNGVCLTQLPAGLNPAAVQVQVFGIPTTSASGDIEILPQGSTFGSTATMVYVGAIAFNTVSTAAKINPANNEISVQVRGGGANLAMDVVGYFAAPSGSGGKFFQQGGNAFGATAILGTTEIQPLEILIGGQRAMRYEPVAGAPNVVGGSPLNATTGTSGAQTIAGGGFSGTCETSDASKSGPCQNQTGGDGAVVGGGVGNVANSGSTPTVSGGWLNTASSNSATVGGGEGNTASNFASTVAGGSINTASGTAAIVVGGQGNIAAGTDATVAGGIDNAASGQSASVGGGHGNTASGNYSTVPGGLDNVASGAQSFAAGTHANADGQGCFVFADSSSNNSTSCFNPNVFVARALNGFFFYTSGSSDATYAGAQLPAGSSAWTALSDRNSKDNVTPVDPREVLNRLAAIPIATWNWKSQDASIRHMGPMAQDFHAGFSLGNDDRHITTVDAEGVALAAIQGLHQLVQEKDARIDALEREQRATATETAELRQKVEDLIARLR